MVEQIIMRSGANTLNGFNFDHIVPASGADFEEQVKSCIEQLNEFIHQEEDRHLYIVEWVFTWRLPAIVPRRAAAAGQRAACTRRRSGQSRESPSGLRCP